MQLGNKQQSSSKESKMVCRFHRWSLHKTSTSRNNTRYNIYLHSRHNKKQILFISRTTQHAVGMATMQAGMLQLSMTLWFPNYYIRYSLQYYNIFSYYTLLLRCPANTKESNLMEFQRHQLSIKLYKVVLAITLKDHIHFMKTIGTEAIHIKYSDLL